MNVHAIIFYDIIINIAQCATVNVVKADGSQGAILTSTYVGGGRVDINLPENYETAFRKWQELMKQLSAPSVASGHQHGDLPPHSH